MTFSWIKKIIIASVMVLTSLVGIQGDVFAQTSGPLENVQIDAANKVLYGKIIGNDPESLIVFSFQTATVSEQLSESLPWKEGNFSISLSQYAVFDTQIKRLDDDVRYNNLAIKKETNGFTDSEPLQVFTLADIIKSDISQNQVTVSSWTGITIEESDPGAYFYVFSSAGPVKRTRNETVYLNTIREPVGGGTPEYIPLCAFPEEASDSFNVSYPSCYEKYERFKKELEQSPFEPGYTYKLYFSDEAKGDVVINSGGQTFELPQINLVAGNASVDATDSETQATQNQEESIGALSNQATANVSGGGNQTLNNTQQDVINEGIVPTNCGYNLANNGVMCGFSHFISLIQRVIEYIFVLVLPIAAIVFAYAGFLYLTSGGNPQKHDAAKRAMTNLIIGVVIIMAAWLIVKTLLVSLGVNEDASWFYLGK